MPITHENFVALMKSLADAITEQLNNKQLNVANLPESSIKTELAIRRAAPNNFMIKAVRGVFDGAEFYSIARFITDIEKHENDL